MAQYSIALLLTLGAIVVSGGLYFAINLYRPIHTPEPVSDTSIRRTATRLLKRYRANAGTFAAERAAALRRAGDETGAATWERIREVVEGLLAARREKMAAKAAASTAFQPLAARAAGETPSPSPDPSRTP